MPLLQAPQAQEAPQADQAPQAGQMPQANQPSQASQAVPPATEAGQGAVGDNSDGVPDSQPMNDVLKRIFNR
ncbi:Lethal(3)malignant brain tumor-like 3 protein (L(3)mbt-like 3 protein) (fragment) [Bradyrhizobium sp. STM 3809]